MLTRTARNVGRLCLIVTVFVSYAARMPATATASRGDIVASDVNGPFTAMLAGPALFDRDIRTLPVANAIDNRAQAMPAHDQLSAQPHRSGPPAGIDTALQRTLAAAAMPAPLVNFDGQGPAVDPPDTNGDIGPNHYVQMVNVQFSIYDRSGTLLAGPTSMNSFFDGTGTLCDDHNGGDTVVLYDPYADRWILTDLGFNRDNLGHPTGPYYQCIAISRTGDPVAGGWYQYGLLAHNTILNDYPKFGVWPDGYYLSANMGGCCGGGSWVRVWAFDRASMLYGGPANAIYFDVPSGYNSLLPSNARGANPPAGAPNYFTAVDYGDSNIVHLWRFHADFGTPANSWFGTASGNSNPVNITVAAYTHPSAGVPQPATTTKLDVLGDRMMYGLQYRYLDGIERLWMNHSVDSGSGQTGIRWYEIRNPNGAPPSLYQQGTFNNGADGLHRWMGALAVDRFGNMAVGYNTGNGSTYAGIRYTGRYAADTLGTLSQGEVTLQNGTGSQNNCSGAACTTRWGDYSYMSIDPKDDCTFWLTAEYATNTGGYHTRIGSFRFSGCSPSIIVDSANDTDTRGCSTAPADCTLRGAINLLNTGGFDGATIQFDAAVSHITPATPLPTFTASRNSIAGNLGVTRIDGINLANNTVGLGLNASDVNISGLSFVNTAPTDGSDIRVYGGTRNAIFANFLGTVPPNPGVTNCTSGGAATRNGRFGILVDNGVSGSTVTGTGSVYIYQNTIGCHSDGIYLWGADYAHIGDNRNNGMDGNYIGSNSSGIPLGNSASGVVINQYSDSNGASYNYVRNNGIVNNGTYGVYLWGNGLNNLNSSVLNMIAGNNIGANGMDGILVTNGAILNTIGGPGAADGNGIYGNGENGVQIANSNFNAVIGNQIGSVTGHGANGGNGLRIYGGEANQVGRFCFLGCGSEKGNVISGNNGDGVQIVGGSRNNTLILNLIGTNTAGMTAVPNNLSGVAIFDGASQNQIGLAASGKPNLIAGNKGYGIYIAGATTTSNTIEYNDVGVNSGALPLAAGNTRMAPTAPRIAGGGGGTAIPNGGDGIILWDGTHGNVITGSNWVAYNAFSGLYISGGSHHNTIGGNQLFLNGYYGAMLDGVGTAENEFKGTAISNNGLDGIGERNSAGNNRWTALSVSAHHGLGIDKAANSDSADIVTAPFPVMTSVAKSGGFYVIKGRATPSTFGLFSTLVEVYEVWINTSGYGEGYVYRGSTATDGNGNWQLTVAAGARGCFTAFQTDFSILGYYGSGEFGPNSCRTFAPVTRRGS